MINGFNLRRIAAAGLTVVLCAALAACFVLPGKFAETLDVRKDGRFSYAYKGEIVVLGLTKLMGMANSWASLATRNFLRNFATAKGPGVSAPAPRPSWTSRRPIGKPGPKPALLQRKSATLRCRQ